MENENTLRKLNDRQLITSLKQCAADERRSLIKMLRRVAEVERRELYLRWGYSSMFLFCMRECTWSEDVSCMRIAASRAAAKFPILYRRLANGTMTLTAASRIAKHLTKENYKQLLDRCSGLSLRETDRIVAEFVPKPQTRDRVRHLGVAKPAKPDLNSESEDLLLGAQTPASPTFKPQKTDAKERIEVRFSADEALSDRLIRARELLRNKYPVGRFEDVFMDALEALLEKIDPERRQARRQHRLKFPAATTTHRDIPPLGKIPDNRHIRQKLRDEIWLRDQGQCVFVGEDGNRCSSQEFLQIDHVTPWALGGSSSDPRNLRILCARHNTREAALVFGDKHMAQFRRNAGSPG